MYKLCLPNGYTYDIDIYTGKRINPSKNGHAYDVVHKLIDSIFYKDRVLYKDSYYSSISLAQSLLQKNKQKKIFLWHRQRAIFYHQIQRKCKKEEK